MATTKLYIYGASGHGKVVADIAKSVGYSEIVFLDDNSESKFTPNLPKADIIIAIGDCNIREKLQLLVQNHGFNLATLIHPSAIISPSATIKQGSVIMPNATINAYATIGQGVIINSGAIIEHECQIGDFTHICPRVAIAGQSKIGSKVWLGIGSSVIQQINIADNVYIGAGSVVINDIGSCKLAYGSPCKIIK